MIFMMICNHHDNHNNHNDTKRVKVALLSLSEIELELYGEVLDILDEESFVAYHTISVDQVHSKKRGMIPLTTKQALLQSDFWTSTAKELEGLRDLDVLRPTEGVQTQ